MNFFPPCLFFPYSLGYLDKINNKTITGTWTSNFPGPMAQRPWPRPCGCQVPRTAEPPLSAAQRQRDRAEWEGGTAISPRTSARFPAPGGLPSGHLLPDTEAAQGGGIFQSPSYLPLPRSVGRKAKQFSGFVASFAARSWSARLRRAGGSSRRAWGAGSPLLWGEGDQGYSVGTEPASGGGRSPAKPSSAEVH